MINNNYNHLQKAMPYLHEYAKKAICANVTETGDVKETIEVYVNSFAIPYHEIHISDLLAGMGYTIRSNHEKIYIE